MGLFAFVDPGTKVWSEWETQLPMQSIFVVRVLRLLILPASFLLNAKPTTTTETRSPFSKPKLIMTICVYNKQLHGPFVTVGLIPITHALIWPHYQQSAKEEQRQATMNQHPPVHPPSTGCLDLLSCGWTSTELIFGFCLSNQFCRK